MNHGTTLARRALLVLGSLALLACEGARNDASADRGARAQGADAGEAEAAPRIEAVVAPSRAAPHDAPAEAAAKAAEPEDRELPTIGVAECDDYIATMDACFASDVIPLEERERQRAAFEASLEGWAKAVAANTDDGATLVIGCNAALDLARSAYPRCFEGG